MRSSPFKRGFPVAKVYGEMWKPIPTEAAVIDVLRRSGACSDEELVKALKKNGSDVGPEALNKALLRLEIRGLIRVFNITRNRKKIEIAQA